MARNRNLFTKADFVINMRNRTIKCPAGEIEYFRPGSVVEFDPGACGRCPQRARCTMASSDSRRTISIAEDEQLQHRLRKLTASPTGRHALRERVAVEHRRRTRCSCASSTSRRHPSATRRSRPRRRSSRRQAETAARRSPSAAARARRTSSTSAVRTATALRRRRSRTADSTTAPQHRRST